MCSSDLGTLTNCTFPTLNQNTTGSAASLSISGQTGLLTFTGLASTNRAKTVRDAADTILELGGSYTPTGTWTSMALASPTITGSQTSPYAQVASGRLTLTSGTPVLTGSVTSAGTVYFTPYKGNQIGLYTGSAWKLMTFSELSITLSTLSASTAYDVFAYDNSGTVALETVAWTNSTTRATALTTQDGVMVKSGTTTRRYLGSFITDASKQCSVTFGSAAAGGGGSGHRP